jgi:hypothetical protein
MFCDTLEDESLVIYVNLETEELMDCVLNIKVTSLYVTSFPIKDVLLVSDFESLTINVIAVDLLDVAVPIKLLLKIKLEVKLHAKIELN